MRIVFKSPVGNIAVVYERDMLLSLSFAPSEKPVLPEDEFGCTITGQLTEYFAGKRQKFDIPFKLEGTQFQMKIWNALLEIPYGETRSYRQIAEHIGKPKSARAVGGANAHNPIMIIVPCHRVIASDGGIGGYSGAGTDVKRELLRIEGVEITAN